MTLTIVAVLVFWIWWEVDTVATQAKETNKKLERIAKALERMEEASGPHPSDPMEPGR